MGHQALGPSGRTSSLLVMAHSPPPHVHPGSPLPKTPFREEFFQQQHPSQEHEGSQNLRGGCQQGDGRMAGLKARGTAQGGASILGRPGLWASAPTSHILVTAGECLPQPGVSHIKGDYRNSQVVQRLRLGAPRAGGVSPIPSQGIRSHILKLKDPTCHS